MNCLTRISGEEIKENHRNYVPPKGMAIIYLLECYARDKDKTYYYVGSTDGSLLARQGENGINYIYGPKTKTKLSKFILKYGFLAITSRILWVVPEEYRAQVEQEEIDKYDAINLGFNSIRAVKEYIERPKKYATQSKEDKSARNKPTEVTEENLQLTIHHRDGSSSTVLMNKGFHQHYFKNVCLGLSTPGMKGHISMPKGKDGIRSPLTYLSRDLGVGVKYGPDGPHAFTLDNIYIKGTKTNLRTFLDQNPIHIKGVSYFTFGQWDTEEVEA